MKFISVEDTRFNFKLAMINASYGHRPPASFYRVNRRISQILSSPDLPETQRLWYLYLLTLGLEQSNRWLLGKPIISQEHLETLRLAMSTVELHAVNSEVMLNFFVKPEVFKKILSTLVCFFDEPESDLAAIQASSGILDSRLFTGLPLVTRLKLQSVWLDPFGYLQASTKAANVVYSGRY